MLANSKPGHLFVFSVLCISVLGGSLLAEGAEQGSPAQPQAAKEGRRYALVIGINDYERLGTLDCARQDAEELARVLVERGGFQRQRLRLVTDGQRPAGLNWSSARFTDLLDGFRQFTSWPRPGDTLLIFFAGHGVTIGNEAYLMPVDGFDESTGLSLSWLRQLTAECKATTKVLILDACHSGKVVRGVTGIAPSLAQGAATLVLASCADKEISYPEDGHGVFTAGLLQGLSGLADADKDGVITGAELFEHTRQHVEDWCIAHPGMRQTPQMIPEEAGAIVIARVPDEVRLAAEREQRYRQALAEGDALLRVQQWTQAEGAFRRALAVEGYAGEPKALDGLKTARGGADAYGKRVAYEEALRQAQAACARAEGTEDKALWQAVSDEARRAAETGHSDLSAARALLEEAAMHLGPALELTLDLGGGVAMKLVLIRAGEFMMGSPAGEPQRGSDEGPQHRVRITRAFYMGATEVTQAQYEAVTGTNASIFKGADNPVETVSWNDAAEFCRRLSAKAGMTVRLPTEAEWEYACRAGTTTPFYFGDTISTDQANYDGNYVYGAGRKGVYRQRTTPVGSFPPNAWGLYDMHGNVWEWCQDWYGNSYYASSPMEDPQGPPSAENHVLRGGSWYGNPRGCRSAYRYGHGPSDRDSYVGFRVAVVPG
jgi:formylglycine-generating enzyme required for sulfatase activity